MIKKLAALTLALLMTLSMAACGDQKDDQAGGAVTPGVTDDTVPDMGTVSGGTYTNRFAGISCTLAAHATHIRSCLTALCLLHVLIHLCEQLLCTGCQLFLGCLQLINVIVTHFLILGSLEDILDRFKICLNRSLLRSIDLVSHLAESLFCLEYEGICLVTCINGFLSLLILCFKLSSFLNSLINFSI